MRERARWPIRTRNPAARIIAKLRKTIDNKNRELSQLRADVPALVRVVNQLTLENEQLRNQIGQPTDVVIAFPDRRSTQRRGL